jgi:hypothetical protein
MQSYDECVGFWQGVKREPSSPGSLEEDVDVIFG